LATFPGANGLIAYSTGEIFTISPAGGDPTRLTDNAIGDAQPSWSADGRRLAFVREAVKYGPTDVWTMHSDGTHQGQVTRGPAWETSPSFSPGGGRIVMSRNGRIVIARTDGTESVRLTHDWAAWDPAFSPNGRLVVFAGAPGKGRPRGIWVMGRDGTHKRLLRANPNVDEPDFDPDGSHIVFHRLSNCVSHTCDDDVVLMRADGRRKRRITDIAREPVFSPNGRRIAAAWFSCDALTETCHSKLLTFDRHGSDGQFVTDSISSPSWQPIPQP
jgi:Tol biopolymer transport system component